MLFSLSLTPHSFPDVTLAFFLDMSRILVCVEAAVAPIHAKAHAELGWRIFNTHLYWEMLPRGGQSGNASGTASGTVSGTVSDTAGWSDDPKVRYVYVVRSARDVCASFWHHFSHMHTEDGGEL